MSSDDIENSHAESQDAPSRLSASVTTSRGKTKRRLSFWHVLGWILLTLLLLIIIASAYMWQNRYSILEDGFKDILAEQGLEAELTIDEIGKTSAALSGITITAEGKDVFSAQTLNIEYYWREALNGRMKRIELGGARLKLTVDETGKIIDGWLPASNDESAVILPPQGLHLSDSEITLVSPYGQVNAGGDVTLLSQEDIKADFIITPSVFSFGSLQVTGGGDIKARIRPGENAVEAALEFTNITHPLASLSSVDVSADVIFDYIDGQSQVSGPISLEFAELDGGAARAQNGQFEWDGSFAVRPDSAAIRAADGHWRMAMQKVSIAEAARRQDLAKKLTLFDAMSAAPVAEHFAQGLTDSVRALMVDAELSAAGQFMRAGERIQLSLDSPLQVRAKDTNLVISPEPATPLYEYNRETEAISLYADAAIEGAYPLIISKARVTANSLNGVSLQNVAAFSAQAVLPKEWTARSPEGPVRLAPLSADIGYINQGPRRDMFVTLPIEYDGPLPGGFVQGFKTFGTLGLDMRGGGLETSFAPKDSAPISIGQFDMASGWRARNAEFLLLSDAPFYSRGDESGHLSARIEAVSADVIEIETGRQLAVTLDGADISAAITDARQDWSLIMNGAAALTDDFAGEGTEFGARQATLIAVLQPESAPQIDLDTQSARVRTDQISTQNMPVKIKGTPADFQLDFGGQNYASAGKVNFIGQDLPALPLRGGFSYEDGKITGTAVTVLPAAEDVDIDIRYEMKDGVGRAVVDISELRFEPGKLQPQDLVPTLRGKMADVTGTVSAQFDMAFAPDTPLESFGVVKIADMNFGTLPGPFTGVNTELVLTSVFPLKTQGLQKLYVESFNPGVALNEGVIEYELESKGLRIHSARWPLAGGALSLDPTLWEYAAAENRVVVRIDGISVGAFLEGKGGGNLTATGDVVGTIPVIVEGVNVSVDKGELNIENGGIIQYRSRQLKSAVDLIPNEYVTYQDVKQIQDVRKKKDLGENVGKDLAFTALRNFEYQSLSAKFDGPLDGEVEVNLKFEGRNPDILAGTRFAFDINVVGELVNLVRSLKVDGDSERIKGYLDIIGRERAKTAPDTSIPQQNVPPEQEDIASLSNILDIKARSPQIQLTQDINP